MVRQKNRVCFGLLLTSTLSLVIAAATIGERLHIISANMSGALTLVAVIASIITPIGFKKLFKRQSAPQEKAHYIYRRQSNDAPGYAGIARGGI